MVVNPGDKKMSHGGVPFPAIVGQESLKRALVLASVNDDLNGVLLTGEKGTAKSTAVRALVDVLPEQAVVADCPYGCSPTEPAMQCEACRERDPDELPVETRPVPLVTLPLGATRDRVVGTLSIEEAMAGEVAFDPGLLAAAHRGILYVDEVNLLEDHLVDVLLDVAASGVNVVERDGTSVSHPAAFTLIGTMNPEEGDLRPQLHDRFDLQAIVTGCEDVADRVAIIDRVLEDGDNARAPKETERAVADLRERIVTARNALRSVTLPASFKTEIATLCLEAGVDGHRGDIATARTAMTVAALEGRTRVIEADVREAASYTLPHRLRSQPFEEPPDLEELLDSLDESDGDNDESEAGDEPTEEGRDGDDGENGGQNDDRSSGPDDDSRSGDTQRPDDGKRSQSEADGDEQSQPKEDGDKRDQSKGSDQGPSGVSESSTGGSSEETSEAGNGDDEEPGDSDSKEAAPATPVIPGQTRADIGEASAPDVTPAETQSKTTGGDAGSRTQATPSTTNTGPRVRTERATEDQPVDGAASIRAAATRGSQQVDEQDLRTSVRAGKASTTIVFVVDASTSMRPAMRAAKGVVLELLEDAYKQRDEVAFVAFAGDDAEVLLPPTRSVTLAARHLKEVPTGGRTPLPAGLRTAATLLERADTEAGVVVLVTDGRATVREGSPTAQTRAAARTLSSTGAHVLVVDASDSGSRTGVIESILEATAGERIPLSALTGARLEAATESALDGRPN